MVYSEGSVWFAQTAGVPVLERTLAEGLPRWTTKTGAVDMEAPGNLAEQTLVAHQANLHRRKVILVPVDFTPGSTRVTEAGIEMARKMDALLTLVHAIHLNLSPYGPASPDRLKVELFRESVAQAEPLLQMAHRAGVPATCAIAEGAPAEVITKLAEHWQAAAVILARPRPGFLARWLGKRTVERVMERVRCPVVTLAVTE